MLTLDNLTKIDVGGAEGSENGIGRVAGGGCLGAFRHPNSGGSSDCGIRDLILECVFIDNQVISASR